MLIRTRMRLASLEQGAAPKLTPGATEGQLAALRSVTAVAGLMALEQEDCPICLSPFSAGEHLSCLQVGDGRFGRLSCHGSTSFSMR